jgi:hypothetical protein
VSDRSYVFGSEVFVKVGGSLYRRTHVSVVFVACPVCKAKIGECCTADGEPKGGTHYRRRNEYKKLPRPRKQVVIVSEPLMEKIQ